MVVKGQKRARASARGAAVAALVALVVSGGAIAPRHASAVALPRISITDAIVGESDGEAVLKVTLSAPSASVVSVNFGVSNSFGNATRNVDYLSTGGTLTFAPGERTKTIPLQILDNPDQEGLESVVMVLFTPVNATIAKAESTVLIVDNDTVVGTPRVFARAVTVDEKMGTAWVPVLLGGPAGQASDRTVTVHYATANGTAIAGRDYRATQGTLSFAPGETVQNVPIVITDDTVAEGAETLSLKLSSVTNARIATPATTVRIGASDGLRASLPRVSIADAVVGESVGWTDLVVTLSAPSASVVSVNFGVSNSFGNATRNVDYLSTGGTLTFAPGERTKTIPLQILDNPDQEGLESVVMVLFTPVNATIAKAESTVRIRDND